MYWLSPWHVRKRAHFFWHNAKIMLYFKTFANLEVFAHLLHWNCSVLSFKVKQNQTNVLLLGNVLTKLNIGLESQVFAIKWNIETMIDCCYSARHHRLYWDNLCGPITVVKRLFQENYLDVSMRTTSCYILKH